MTEQGSSLRIIRMRELVSKVGYARSTIHALIKEGRFPEPLNWFQMVEPMVGLKNYR